MKNKSKKTSEFIKHNSLSLPREANITDSSASLENKNEDNESILKKAIASLQGKKLFEKQNEEADRQLDRSTFKISSGDNNT